jgi:hypothetical protein
MIIVVIDHNDFEGSPSERLCGGKSTKPRSDDNDAGARKYSVEPVQLAPLVFCLNGSPTSPSFSTLRNLSAIDQVSSASVRRIASSHQYVG